MRLQITAYAEEPETGTMAKFSCKAPQARRSGA